MSYIFLVPTAIVYLIGFIVLNGLFEISILVMVSIGLTLIYMGSSSQREDILSVVKHDDRVYFNISDDIFFSVDMVKNSKFDESTISKIEERVSSVRDVITRVEFVNFYDENLYMRLINLIGNHKI